MTKAQTIEVAQSKARERINALLGIETRSPAEQNEMVSLTETLQKLEPELRAALVAESSDARLVNTDGEGAELRSLVQRASLGEYVREALTKTPLSEGSAEVELRSAIMGENARPNVIPLGGARSSTRRSARTSGRRSNHGRRDGEDGRIGKARSLGAYSRTRRRRF